MRISEWLEGHFSEGESMGWMDWFGFTLGSHWFTLGFSLVLFGCRCYIASIKNKDSTKSIGLNRWKTWRDVSRPDSVSIVSMFSMTLHDVHFGPQGFHIYTRICSGLRKKKKKGIILPYMIYQQINMCWLFNKGTQRIYTIHKLLNECIIMNRWAVVNSL